MYIIYMYIYIYKYIHNMCIYIYYVYSAYWVPPHFDRYVNKKYIIYYIKYIIYTYVV